MFCPRCGAEYRPEITRCADCEVELVAEPPPPREHPEPDLVDVFETADPALLPVVQSLLEAAGIDAWAQGDETLNVLPVGEFGSAGWGGGGHGLSVRIRVPRAQAERARTLLDEVESADEPPPAPDEPR